MYTSRRGTAARIAVKLRETISPRPRYVTPLARMRGDALLQIRQHRRGQSRNPRRASPPRTRRRARLRRGSLVRTRSTRCSANSSAPTVRVFAVSSGTAANSLALATLCPPWGTVLTHAEAHIERDECGAPEFFTGGAKLSLVGGAGAKIAAADLARAARRGSSRTCTACSRACCRSRRRPSAAPIYTPRRSARSPKSLMSAAWPCTWTARASRMRWWRRDVSPAELTLESRRRRAVVRRHQEWRHECGGRGVLRSDPGRGLRVPPQARGATLLQGTIRRRAAYSPTSKVVCGGAMPSEPTASRRASPPPRRSC